MVNTKESQIRLLWADSLKGGLILLVVLGHALQWTLGEDMNNSHLWNWIYSFHMPAFMAISGWLMYRPKSKVQSTGRLILRRAQQLLVPYFCWSFISAIIHQSRFPAVLIDFMLYPDSYFWFLWVLFFIHFIFIIVEEASKRFHFHHTIAILMVALILVILMVVTECRLCGFQYISYYFMFFSFGYLIHRYHVLQTRRLAILVPCIIMWLLLAWWWKMHDLPTWVPAIPGVPTAVLLYAYRSIVALLATFVILNISPWLFDPSRFPNIFIPTIGQWSLGIYTAHLSLISILKRWLVACCPPMPDWVFVSVLFIASLAISLCIVWVVIRNKYTARILMGKL